MSIQLNTVQTLGAAAVIAVLIGSLSAISITNLTAPDEYEPADHEHDLLDHDHDLPDHTHQPANGEGGKFTFTFEAYLSGYIGVGGDIDGLVNPVLQVDEYSEVTIILLAGDSRRHDFVIDELIQSGEVDPDENVNSLTFTFFVEGIGSHTYYCSVTGHYATMNGIFNVGDSANLPGAAIGLDNNVIKKPNEIPDAVGDRAAQDIEITLVTKEVNAKLDDGTSFTFWTFNGTVPGPMIRVRIGDNVTINLQNEATSNFTHSVDFHAVNANGGGAAATQAAPGTTESFWFIPEWEGAFVYHCASPHIPTHISKGMYGAISVEPAAGLDVVDYEFYVGQSEIYTEYPKGTQGHQTFSGPKQLTETPDYVIFNGQVNALTQPGYTLNVTNATTVRIFFAVGGPNVASNFHLIGGVWDRVYYEMNWTEPNMINAETIVVAPGSVVAVEVDITRLGTFILVDHALTRTFDKGSLGFLYSNP